MDFSEAVKIVRAAYEKLGVVQHWATYQVASGMPGPAYLLFLPLKSLEEVDAGLGREKALREAEGEDNATKLQKIAADAYISSESNIFAFSPKMSYPSKEWIAGDPEFWTPKASARAGSGKKTGGRNRPRRHRRRSRLRSRNCPRDSNEPVIQRGKHQIFNWAEGLVGEATPDVVIRPAVKGATLPELLQLPGGEIRTSEWR
jgi:hypothetical protein